MKYRVFCVGKIKDAFYRQEIEAVCDEAERRGRRIEIVEFPDEKIPEKLKEKNREAFLEKECAGMEGRLSSRDYVVALCIEGKELTTSQHRAYVKRAKEEGKETVTYIIGGSLGLPLRIKQRADLKFSFSKMTFPHQMMRLVLCEEIAGI
ncbi:MAG: 23S rRNA (pseudouridine(1915)-N(3))-methyltransferase RlmH [Bacteroidales bacterium]|nr:23S rRNA (pseudouridine(1915)-N(3))-methyltransferase RlmH [Clostridium sp.]MCM1202676.1 23S rRNA (pseudouridine(1915)-N(3))-methyltransferase RlmH [Bacteroidales bacterium]